MTALVLKSQATIVLSSEFRLADSALDKNVSLSGRNKRS